MGFETLDESGKRYGRLVVIERAPKRVHQKPVANREGAALWRCICDCGRETATRGWMLRAGKAKSCGCIRRENFKPFTLPPGVAALNRSLSNIKRNAKTRSYEWLLSDQQAFALMTSDCFYCDVPPGQIIHHARSTGNAPYNGIDRVDNEKGYLVDNCVACCGVCNSAKADLTLDEFKGWIDRMIRMRPNW